jgi:hypothetical protein
MNYALFFWSVFQDLGIQIEENFFGNIAAMVTDTL